LPVDNKLVVWFDEVTKDDVSTVGGKGANLGEMTRAQIPVPPGFVVTSTGYLNFLHKAGLSERLHELLTGLDVNDSKLLQRVRTNISYTKKFVLFGFI